VATTTAAAFGQQSVRREGGVPPPRDPDVLALLDPAERPAAARRLFAAGAGGVSDLVRLLASPDRAGQMAALTVLHALGPEGAAAEPVVRQLLARPTASTRAAALTLAAIRPSRHFVITAFAAGKLLEIDDEGHEVGTLVAIDHPWSAKPLPSGNYLVADATRVVEVACDGTAVRTWNVPSPLEAKPLLDGNLLVACWQTGDGVREISPAGNVVWEVRGVDVSDAERLVDGHTLLADRRTNRLLEYAPDHRVVWSVPVDGQVGDVDRLPNGNTLATFDKADVVREYDPRGQVVWELPLDQSPEDSERLADGRTIVAVEGSVRAFDRRGKELWRLVVAGQVGDVTVLPRR